LRIARFVGAPRAAIERADICIDQLVLEVQCTELAGLGHLPALDIVRGFAKVIRIAV
jgi:hypothetical protein